MSAFPLLEELFPHLDDLFKSPFVALQANSLLENPNSNVQDLAQVIQRDPELTHKVIQLCNSAQFSSHWRIETISQAVSFLGYKELKEVVLTVLFHWLLNRSVEGYGLEKGALWENAVTCGVYASHIAKQVKFKQGEFTFIAGLVRDLGKIVIGDYIGRHYTDLMTLLKNTPCSFETAETRILGVSHSQVGAQLAKHWDLDDQLVKVIEYHHQPGKMPLGTPLEDKMLVSIVHIADSFTMMYGTGVGMDGLMYPMDPSVFQTLNLPYREHELEKLYAEVLTLKDVIDDILETLEPERKYRHGY